MYFSSGISHEMGLPSAVRAGPVSRLRGCACVLCMRLTFVFSGPVAVNYACEWVGGQYVPKENVRQSASGPVAVKPGTVVNPMRADAQEFI